MKWCVYHSPEWALLVEMGWTTAIVEPYPIVPFGPVERVAIMVPTGKGRRS